MNQVTPSPYPITTGDLPPDPNGVREAGRIPRSGGPDRSVKSFRQEMFARLRLDRHKRPLWSVYNVSYNCLA